MAVALASACGEDPEASRPPESYLVRGIIRQLPVANRAQQELLVHHEALPGFTNADGEIVGMEAMTMPFPLADPELISGLEAGDRIEMEFEVRWQGGNPLTITAVERLPPEARLAFEAEDENGGEPAP